MTDFFISYTSADEAWAEWIGHVLEDAGLEVIVQAWDFRPGSNFVLKMLEATASAGRTIIVLSPNYLNSRYAAPEWASAFADDPQGANHKLVPVIVRDCQPEGILKSVVHINLIGLDEVEAARFLLAGVDADRAKPSARPPFPGAGRARPGAPFPGTSSSGDTKRIVPTYMPKVKRKATDLEKHKFLKQAFAEIQDYFRHGVVELSSDPHVHGEFETDDGPVFAVEIEVDQGGRAACRAWIGNDFLGDSICYAEGHRLPRGDACNEILSIAGECGDLTLSAMMDMGIRFRGTSVPIDTKKMTTEQAADYLWRRFVSHLET
jgi:hypothetical protein